jgi:hypothetical protein
MLYYQEKVSLVEQDMGDYTRGRRGQWQEENFPVTHISTSIFGPAVLLLDLGRFYRFLILYTVVGLVGRGISPSQGLYLHTEKHKHRINRLHALGWIRSHDSSVRGSEDSSCLRRRFHRDQLWFIATLLNFFFNSGLWGYWHCGHSWPIVPASGDNEDDCREADGM